MASSVIYLDVDDEITSAAGRIRAVEGRRVAVVLPYGSRVATSRINFRLLSRDALTHEKRLSIVAADAATRALAASAGLPVFATLAEYETSLGEEGAIADRPVVRPTDRPATVVPPVAAVAASGIDEDHDEGESTLERSATVVTPPSTGSPGRRAATRPTTAQPAAVAAASVTAQADPDPVASAPVRTQPVAASSGRRIGRTPIFVGLAVLGLAVVVGGVAAYLLLPSASAVVTPREETIGPVSLRISASTEVDEPDVEAGLVPAVVESIDVEATDTFDATGKRVEETKARGTVQFQNLDPTSSNTIAKGSVVSTASGIRFRTDARVTVDPAELVGVTIFPAKASVKVTAVDAGPEGNVGAGSIQRAPSGELFLNATNPLPTSGGDREVFPRVTQDDVDAAIAALAVRLDAAFAEQLADPDLVEAGITVFPETAALGEATPTVDPETLVGDEVETFDLGSTATGTVTTVDSAPVQVIAEARLVASVEPGHELVEGSSFITEAPAVVEGDTITYPVVATAKQVAVLDPAVLQAEILGKPVADARAILEGYGEAILEVWPDWVSTIPTFESRVEVTVEGPVAGSPDPSASPESTP